MKINSVLGNSFIANKYSHNYVNNIGSQSPVRFSHLHDSTSFGAENTLSYDKVLTKISDFYEEEGDVFLDKHNTFYEKNLKILDKANLIESMFDEISHKNKESEPQKIANISRKNVNIAKKYAQRNLESYEAVKNLKEFYENSLKSVTIEEKSMLDALDNKVGLTICLKKSFEKNYPLYKQRMHIAKEILENNTFNRADVNNLYAGVSGQV